MPIYKNAGRFVVSHIRRGVNMRTSVTSKEEADEKLRSMKEDDIIDLTKTRYYFSKEKILIVHLPNLRCQTYESLYGLRDTRV